MRQVVVHYEGKVWDELLRIIENEPDLKLSAQAIGVLGGSLPDSWSYYSRTLEGERTVENHLDQISTELKRLDQNKTEESKLEQMELVSALHGIWGTRNRTAPSRSDGSATKLKGIIFTSASDSLISFVISVLKKPGEIVFTRIL